MAYTRLKTIREKVYADVAELEASSLESRRAQFIHSGRIKLDSSHFKITTNNNLIDAIDRFTLSVQRDTIETIVENIKELRRLAVKTSKDKDDTSKTAREACKEIKILFPKQKDYSSAYQYRKALSKLAETLRKEGKTWSPEIKSSEEEASMDAKKHALQARQTSISPKISQVEPEDEREAKLFAKAKAARDAAPPIEEKVEKKEPAAIEKKESAAPSAPGAAFAQRYREEKDTEAKRAAEFNTLVKDELETLKKQGYLGINPENHPIIEKMKKFTEKAKNKTGLFKERKEDSSATPKQGKKGKTAGTIDDILDFFETKQNPVLLKEKICDLVKGKISKLSNAKNSIEINDDTWKQHVTPTRWTYGVYWAINASEGDPGKFSYNMKALKDFIAAKEAVSPSRPGKGSRSESE